MDPEYELTLHQQSLEIYNLQSKVASLEKENKNLKESIATMAMENSFLLEKPKKRKFSEDVLQKWAFYHANKEGIKRETGFTDWRLIKKKSDELFASHR
jgi:regulator of replication initiation timing